MKQSCHGADSVAELCSDQLPIYSNIGRGPSGTSYKVEVEGGDNPVLVGSVYDPDTDLWSEQWRTPSLGSGKMSYKINQDTPLKGLFTITFAYTHPGHSDRNWEFTTPAIQTADDFNFANYADLNEALGFDIQEILASEDGTSVKKYIDDGYESLDTSLRQFIVEQDANLKTALSSEIDADVKAVRDEVVAMIPTHTPMTDDEVRNIFSKEAVNE